MYFVVMPNRNHSEHLGMFCIVMPSIFVNCPAVICLPNIARYLRETPLVICGPRSYLLHTVYNTSAIICLLFLATPTVFHTVLLTLCSATPERLTTSLFRVGQSSSLFLCRFHVVGGGSATSLQQHFSSAIQILLVR